MAGARIPDAAAHTPAYPEVDLTNCDREPIHIPGAIQPHGMLIAIADDGRAATVSANSAERLGVEPEDALGRTLADLVGPRLARTVAELAEAGFPADPLAVRLDELPEGAGLRGRDADVRAHRSGDRMIVEIEEVGEQAADVLSYQSARGAMSRLAAAPTVPELADQLAREVQDVLGFDRVMVYRFDEQWNGEVIAEQRRLDLNPFLGLHYPATDIPAQARRLYTVNLTRLIVDIGYTPVPLHPVFDPVTHAPLDLSHATLRSVSPIHLEYLSNMGVTASMSISLVIDDQLWGLVACHHYSGPHRPGHDARAAAGFLGQVSSQLIADRVRSETRERRLAAQSALAGVTARVAASSDNPLVTVMDDPDLLSLVNATGAALFYDGVLRTRGDVPDEHLLTAMAAALERPGDYATHTDRIAELVPEMADHPGVAGVMRVGSAPDRWLLWVRPEQPQVVDWGGDPTNKLLAATEDPEVRLSPRKSFEKWRQVVTGRSLPWAPWKVEIADALGKYLIGLLLTRSREQIAMADALQRSVLLEKPPAYPGLEVAARYRPASTYQLGGDWWDALELDDGRYAFVVGDVAGHGVSAATAMTQVRTALRAYLFEGHTAAECLDRLDLLMAGLLDQRVATAVVAVVDPAAGTVEVTSAGHPAPMVVTHETAYDAAAPVRPLLGVGTGAARTATVALPHGAAMILYTDGLVERRGTDLRERTDRMRAIAADTYVGSDLAAWVDRLVDLHDDGGDDDTTLLAIRLLPEPSATQGA